MAKKAIYNLTVGDKSFIKDEIYSDSQVEGIDLSNFIDVADEEIKAEVVDSSVEESVEPLIDSETTIDSEITEDEKKSEEDFLAESSINEETNETVDTTENTDSEDSI